MLHAIHTSACPNHLLKCCMLPASCARRPARCETLMLHAIHTSACSAERCSFSWLFSVKASLACAVAAFRSNCGTDEEGYVWVGSRMQLRRVCAAETPHIRRLHMESPRRAHAPPAASARACCAKSARSCRICASRRALATSDADSWLRTLTKSGLRGTVRTPAAGWAQRYAQRKAVHSSAALTSEHQCVHITTRKPCSEELCDAASQDTAVKPPLAYAPPHECAPMRECAPMHDCASRMSVPPALVCRHACVCPDA
eukprot:364116-Chlamydomonas_euryale.AAC.4